MPVPSCSYRLDSGRVACAAAARRAGITRIGFVTEPDAANTQTPLSTEEH
ncbi:MAG: hypothetical protein IPH23_08075 [Gammaproteobacteria bacterium]|nr:hypothetical protein [Gammaproteobacteria bacterium]